MPDERGRAQLEQRHALPRDELDPLGQQLGRLRRDPHLDASAVGVGDDLEQLALAEVRVGHDQLVHALGLEDRGQVLHVAEHAAGRARRPRARARRRTRSRSRCAPSRAPRAGASGSSPEPASSA